MSEPIQYEIDPKSALRVRIKVNEEQNLSGASAEHFHEDNRCCFCGVEDDHECRMCPAEFGSSPLPAQVEGLATARPWRVASLIRRKREVGAGHQFWIETDDPVLPLVIAELDSDDLERQAEIHANFDLIVTAVNAYEANKAKIEALTAALKECLAFVVSDYEGRGGRDLSGGTIDRARAALALIESPAETK